LRSIYVSSYGIIFLGTPHNGADPAKWGLILQGMNVLMAFLFGKISCEDDLVLIRFKRNRECYDPKKADGVSFSTHQDFAKQ
jgi:hypothetical protein